MREAVEKAVFRIKKSEIKNICKSISLENKEKVNFKDVAEAAGYNRSYFSTLLNSNLKEDKVKEICSHIANFFNEWLGTQEFEMNDFYERIDSDLSQDEEKPLPHIKLVKDLPLLVGNLSGLAGGYKVIGCVLD